MIRVCLVEDQTIVREGLRAILNMVKEVQIVAEAVDGVEAVKVITESAPDVVLLDVKLPRMDGLEALRRLKHGHKMPPTIILTTFDDDEIVLEGVRLGVRGFLLKDVSLDQLANAIRKVHAGGTVIKPALTNRVIQELQAAPKDFPSSVRPEPLSEREVEILGLMCGGYSNKEIADAIFIAEGTVKNHISNILSKLGVRDRTRAVLKAVELGYLG